MTSFGPQHVPAVFLEWLPSQPSSWSGCPGNPRLRASRQGRRCSGQWPRGSWGAGPGHRPCSPRPGCCGCWPLHSLPIAPSHRRPSTVGTLFWLRAQTLGVFTTCRIRRGASATGPSSGPVHSCPDPALCSSRRQQRTRCLPPSVAECPCSPGKPRASRPWGGCDAGSRSP